MTACILSERRATRPFGLCGGQSALPGKNYLIRQENGVDRHISLGGKVTLELQAGDKVRIETPGTAAPPCWLLLLKACTIWAIWLLLMQCCGTSSADCGSKRRGVLQHASLIGYPLASGIRSAAVLLAQQKLCEGQSR